MITATDIVVTASNPVIPTVLSSYDSEREDALARRYNRKAPSKLTFEFTRDPALLHQYYKLRANEFNGILGYTESPMAATEHDRNGHIMVVRSGNFCVGGIRLNIRTPRKIAPLPMEKDDFRLEKHFPYLGDKQMSYGQVGYVVLLPEFRNGDVLRDMVNRIFCKAIALNVNVLFATCTMVNVRRYKIDCVANGWKNTNVHYDVELPASTHVGGIQRYLASSLLSENLSADSAKNRDNFAIGAGNQHLEAVQ